MKKLYHKIEYEQSFSLNDEKELFKKLYVSKVAELTVAASRYVGMDNAEDLVQELFVKIWNKKIFLFIKPEELEYFLFSSIRNACLDFLKHEVVKQDYEDYYRKQLLIEEFEAQKTYFDTYELYKEKLNLIFKEINKLPDSCREIFMEAYMNEKKASQIAEERNISKRTVESQLYKALKILRKCIGILLIFYK